LVCSAFATFRRSIANSFSALARSSARASSAARFSASEIALSHTHLSCKLASYAMRSSCFNRDTSDIDKPKLGPVRYGPEPSHGYSVYDSSIFLRLLFETCSTILRQHFDKPSAMLRENAEAKPSSCRAIALLWWNEFRTVVHPYHPVLCLSPAI